MMESETEKTSYLLWIGSFLIVCGVYAAVSLAFVFFYVPDSRAVGGVEAIMLEFSLEAQAPETEEISEDIREETVTETEEIIEPDPEPVVEPEPEIIEPTPPSDMIEEVKPVEKQEEKPKPKPKVEKIKPKPTAKKAEKPQKARGPDLAAPRGKKYAAPQTNRNFGNQGKAVAGWKTKVQRRIATIAKKYEGEAKVKKPLIATVSFRYDAQGVITAARITRSSGNSVVDAVAVQAVQASSPIPSPPTGQGGSLNVPVRIDR